MKNLLVIFFIFSNLVCYAQKTYLKIYQTKGSDDVIMYPPGTQFELRNEHNYIILKYSETPRTLNIDGDYTLIVFPEYQKERDVYKLTEGRVELALTSEYGQPEPTFESIYVSKNEITAHQTLTESKESPGNKNLVFELSNGITFKYFDGKYYAKLKNTYLDVKGKYIIESTLGTLKLSYNPKTGKVWWIFEEVDN